MNIQKFAKKHKTEIATIGLLVGGSSGPITDLMTTIGLDWNQVIDLILSTNGNTLILWAIIAALYFRKETPDEKIKEQIKKVMEDKNVTD